MSCIVAARLLSFALVGLVGAACAAGAPGTPAVAPVPTTAPAATAAPAANAAQARPAAVPAASPAAIAPAARQAGATGAQAAATPAAQLPIAQSLGRMVIYTTEITMLAADLVRVPDQLGTLVLAHGGYVAGVETSNAGGVPTVVVRLKVPPDQYEATMGAIRTLAVDVRSEKATTQDVTEEYSDAQTQITSLEATHAQLLELMKRAGSVEELLKVQQQADQVRLQIDRLKGRVTALERLSALASIGVTAQLASAVIEQDYSTALAAVRQAESQRAGLQSQLKRSRTPEEETSLRDKLGQADLVLQRERGRVSMLDQLAKRLSIALPKPDESAAAPASDDALPAAFIQTRVDLRRAQADQQQITANLESGAQDANPDRLQAAILRSNDLTTRLKTIQERAGQVGIALPTISAAEETAMAQVPSRPTNEGPLMLRRAWEASLTSLVGIGSVLIFVWWLVLPLSVMAIWLTRRRLFRRVTSRRE
jgi:hypothetical protein